MESFLMRIFLQMPTDMKQKDSVHSALRAKGKVKKEYHQDGLYVTNVTVGSTMMEFELSAKSGNTYTVQKKDNIMNNKKASGSQVDVALITTNRAGTLIRLTMTQKPETDSPLLVYSKIESTEDSPVLATTGLWALTS